MAIGVRHHKITSKSQQLFKARASVIGISRKKRSQPSSLAEVRVANMEARKVTIPIMLPMLPQITAGRASGTAPLRTTTMIWVANNRILRKRQHFNHLSRTTRGRRRRNLKSKCTKITNLWQTEPPSVWTTQVHMIIGVVPLTAGSHNISRIWVSLINRGDRDRRPDLVPSPP